MNTINRTIKLMLCMFGVWPGIPCVTFYKAFWIFTLAITEFLHYRYMITHFHLDNLSGLMDCLSTLLAHVKLTLRIIIFSLKQRKFIEILTTMAEDWRDSSSGGVALREATRKAKLAGRICNGMVILHTVGALLYVIDIFLADADPTDRTIEMPFIMKMEYPFVIDTRHTYRLVLSSQFMFVMVCSWGACLFNAVILTLVLHVGGQINVLLYWLTESMSSEVTEKRSESVSIMAKIIRKHQKVINFSENVENLYSYIALLQFASSTVMICSLGYIIVTAIGKSDAMYQMMRFLIFYAMTNLEAFIFCFAGEYLRNKSIAIGNAAYNSAWFNMKTEDSRILLFVILRSQKQLTLTAGKMVDLSLETFSSIMKASGSYLSVLLAMK